MSEKDFVLHCKNTTIKGQAERITELTNQLAQATEEIERLNKIIDERGKRHADKIANKILGFDKERE